MRNQRLYSLFKVIDANGRKRYVRISQLAFPKPVAVRVFQNALLAPFMGGAPEVRELRPIGKGMFGQ